MRKTEIDNIHELINKVNFWWHTPDFGNGIKTNGFIPDDYLKFISIGIPNDLAGKSVLDVGAWDGYFSFLCENRGAKEVIAIDNNPYMQKNLGFKMAKKIYKSKVKNFFMDLYDIPKKFDRKFDVVLFYGVIYHLKHPLLALEILSNITNEVLILESYCTEFTSKIPIMRFYPGSELNNDSSNWWGPNKQCIIDMLKSSGFNRVEVVRELPNNRIIIRAYK